MDDLDPIIDTFLEEAPLQPLPDGFAKRALRQALIDSHFKLRFLDFALPLFALLFVPLLAVAAWWGYKQIDPIWLAQTRLELEYHWLLLPQQWKTLLLTGLPALALVLVTALVTAACLLFDRFRLQH